MNVHNDEQDFQIAWGEPDLRYVRSDLSELPVLPLADVFGARWTSWLFRAA